MFSIIKSKFNIYCSVIFTPMKATKYFTTTKFIICSKWKPLYVCKVPHNSNYSSLSCNSIFYSKSLHLEKFHNDKHLENGILQISYRSIWGWLNSVFNRVDESRILAAGPDRACAEWLLRCGAGVKWVDSDNFVKDYNSLPVGVSKFQKIEEVDGTDSAVMFVGFPYFRNCKHIRKMTFHKATYLDDDALSHLHLLKDSLQELQISACGNVSREGLNSLKVLINLKKLLLYDLPRIKNKDEAIRDLQEALPQCSISFLYAQASEMPEKEGT